MDVDAYSFFFSSNDERDPGDRRFVRSTRGMDSITRTQFYWVSVERSGRILREGFASRGGIGLHGRIESPGAGFWGAVVAEQESVAPRCVVHCGFGRAGSIRSGDPRVERSTPAAVRIPRVISIVPAARAPTSRGEGGALLHSRRALNALIGPHAERRARQPRSDGGG